MKRLLPVTLAIGLAALAGAQTSPPRVTQSGSIDNMSKIWKTTGVSTQDRQFVMDAFAANWVEIRSSELAKDRATSTWAKQFAIDMLADHKLAQNELRDLADKEGIALPDQAPKAVQAIVNKLAMMNGDHFNSMYREVQIKGHEETAAKLSNEIRNGHDAEVRSFAVKMLPIVKMHLKLAQDHDTMTHMS
jgi:putative membrane protein